MNSKPSSNASAFVAAGALALAYYAAPDADASNTSKFYFGLGSMFSAFASVVLAVQAWQLAEARPSPWPGIAGAILWQARPRGWMIAWAVVIAVFGVNGTPHLAYEYPPRTPVGVCTYVGAKGAVRVTYDGAVCPWFKWL
jgi:hypothetical protein